MTSLIRDSIGRRC